MKNYLLLILCALFMMSCSSTATPTPEPTTIPTPVGYGIEFPFNFDPNKEWGEDVSVTCDQSVTSSLDPNSVRKLVAAGGKIDMSTILASPSENSNLSYLWTGNVPLELFVEPEDDGTGFGIYYDYWGTSYCVDGLDEDVNGWGAYILVITKLMPQ